MFVLPLEVEALVVAFLKPGWRGRRCLGVLGMAVPYLSEEDLNTLHDIPGIAFDTTAYPGLSFSYYIFLERHMSDATHTGNSFLSEGRLDNGIRTLWQTSAHVRSPMSTDVYEPNHTHAGGRCQASNRIGSLWLHLDIDQRPL
jgi:hypothetical protein